MKRWHKRTLCILALGVAGLVALAYRPAFCRDCAEKNKFLRDAVSELSKHDDAQGINLHYTWNLTRHPNGTLLMGDTQPDAFRMLQHATWDIDIRTQNGKMEATYNTPVLHAQDSTHLVKTEYRAYFTRPTLRYTPNGNIAAEHRLHLSCQVSITPCFWGKPICTSATQILRIIPNMGAVDLESAYYTADKIVTENADADLPALYYGTEREKALQYLLYELADCVYSHNTAGLHEYISKATEYVEQLTTADADWPHCWEEGAAEAKRAAQLIEPTLTYLQEVNCLDSQELADFVNGPVFARIFGTELKKRETNGLLDDFGNGTDNIDFEIITEEEFFNDEKN